MYCIKIIEEKSVTIISEIKINSWLSTLLLTVNTFLIPLFQLGCLSIGCALFMIMYSSSKFFNNLLKSVLIIPDAVPAFSDGTLDTAVDSAGVAKKPNPKPIKIKPARAQYNKSC